ncbi:MAG: hypothetical protein HOA81_13100 [Opitutales bacterium]|nr:hypothetical protein [Opitutales bacterium]
MDPLSTILLITTTGGSTNRKGKDSVYFDDFYIDVAGENLNSPSASTWQAIDDLESYTVGDEVDADHTAATTGDWNMYRSADDQYATLPFFGIAADPGDGSQGKVLVLNPGVPTEAGQGNTTLERAVPAAAQIVDSLTAPTKSTFYMKYRRPIVDGSPAESDTTWGMVAETARNAETGIHAYGSYSVLGRTEIDGIIDIRNGGTYENLTAAALETETWYEFWFVVDHANNEFTQYIKGGTDYPTQTQLPRDAAITAQYRNQTLDPLSTILLITTTGGSTNRKGKDPVYFDDFFIDTTGENLNSPVSTTTPVDTTPKAVGEDAGSGTITLTAESVSDAEVGDTVFDGQTAIGIIESISGAVITLENPIASALAAGTTLTFEEVVIVNNDGINVKFVNIATRGLVGANGGEELIAGFVLLGDNPQQVLIRALGPDLADRGVTGVLANPAFEVRNFAQVIVASNDDWGNATDNADVAAAIASASSDPAAGLADGSMDAAVLVTLAPNDVYTVVVSGNGGGGVALVEVFEIDQ